MHSSRMRTARSSSRLLGEGVSASMHAGIHTPWVWDWRTPPGQSPQLPLPPGCGHGDLPPPARPLNLLPGCGPGDPLARPLNLSPWVWAWRPARRTGIPPPHCGQTDTCKNTTFANFFCGW